MLRTAEIVLVGAFNRHESRGAHARTDYLNRDDTNFFKHTLAYHSLARTKDGMASRNVNKICTNGEKILMEISKERTIITEIIAKD